MALSEPASRSLALNTATLGHNLDGHGAGWSVEQVIEACAERNLVLNIIPVGPDKTLETYDFYLETPEPDAMELDAIRYLDEVLQVEDIALVESVQRGMNTPAFSQGRIVHDPDGSGKSEHAVHHFHGLVLDAYQSQVAS